MKVTKTEPDIDTVLLMEIRDLLKEIAMNTAPRPPRRFETKEHGEVCVVNFNEGKK